MSDQEPNINASSSDPLQSLIAEFLDAEDRGETVDREAWLQKNAACADSLRSFLANHDRMKWKKETALEDLTLPTRTAANEDATLPSRAEKFAAISYKLCA